MQVLGTGCLQLTGSSDRKELGWKGARKRQSRRQSRWGWCCVGTSAFDPKSDELPLRRTGCLKHLPMAGISYSPGNRFSSPSEPDMNARAALSLYSGLLGPHL